MEKVETSGSSSRKRRLRELGKQSCIKLRIYDGNSADSIANPSLNVKHFSCGKRISDDKNKTYRHNVSISKPHMDTVRNQHRLGVDSTTKSMAHNVCHSTETLSTFNVNFNPKTTHKSDKLERNDSGYSSDDLNNMDEDDVFETVDVSVKKQAGAPDSVDSASHWARLSESSPVETGLFNFRPSVKPDYSNKIYICHRYATDSVLGDEFGARLLTYINGGKDGHALYNQHFLCDVKPEGAAGLMKIKNWDEIVLVNNMFAPDLTHTDMLNIFHNVKVDGKTRFSLVIRRKKESWIVHKMRWQWYETSAILVAVKKQSSHAPEIIDRRYQALENNQWKLKAVYRFKARGTPNFLDITPSDVSVGVLHDNDTDVTKDITECDIYRENPKTGLPEYVSSLCGHDEKSYLSVDMTNTIVVSERETWFRLKMIGSSVSFQLQETSAYIAVDESGRTLTSQEAEYYFDRVGLPHHQDFPDEGIEDWHQSQQSTQLSSSFNSSISPRSQSSSPAMECLNNDKVNSLGMETAEAQTRSAVNGNGVDIGDVTNCTRPHRVTRSVSRQMSTTRSDFDMLMI